MTEKNYISAYCKIRSGKIIINDKNDFRNEQNLSTVDFLKSAYKHYQMGYSKFYKMDSLCKLAFVCSELLLKSNKITEKYNTEDIAIIIANSTSSLESDTEHQVTINNKENYFPSPTIFVYTLSNIMIGEIAIRNNIKGENTFFIFDKFDAHFMSSYINSLLNTNKAKCCITGWIDFYENKYDAFLCTIEKEKTGLQIENTTEFLNNLYNKK